MTCLHNHDQILEFLRKIFLKGFQIYQNYLCALSLRTDLKLPLIGPILQRWVKFNLSSVQTRSVCQAKTDLFQAVTMPTFVLHGIDLMYAWRTVHV